MKNCRWAFEEWTSFDVQELVKQMDTHLKSIEHAQRKSKAHSEAVRMHAAENISWRTFPGVTTEETKKHFLLRRLCFLSEAAAAFVDNACDVLRQPASKCRL